MDKIKEFEKWATSLAGSRIFIQTHNFPDQDALASAYGLSRLLEYLGLASSLCYKGSIDNMAALHIIDSYNIPIQECGQIHDMEFADKIILVDGQKLNANMTDLPGDEVACIDHHPTNNICEYEYADIRTCGACSSIIAQYFRLLSAPLDEQTATLLLYGLHMDTDNMRRGVTELDVLAFGQLFPLADHSMLKRLAGCEMRENDLRGFGAAIENMRISKGIGCVYIPFDCDDYLIARVADFTLSIAEIDTALVYSRRTGGLKFSCRTILPNVHCGHLLKECLGREGGNGGGHAHMAGGFLAADKLPSLYDPNQSWETRKREENNFKEHLLEGLARYISKYN